MKGRWGLWDRTDGDAASRSVARSRVYSRRGLFVSWSSFPGKEIFYPLTAGELVIMVLSSALMGSRAMERARNESGCRAGMVRA
jgi:hypothetical protein